MFLTFIKGLIIAVVCLVVLAILVALYLKKEGEDIGNKKYWYAALNKMSGKVIFVESNRWGGGVEF